RIDLANGDMRRYPQDYRGVVKDGLDAALDQQIGRFLGPHTRGGDNADANTLLTNRFHQLIHGSDLEIVHHSANGVLIEIEEAGNREGRSAESPVIGNRVTELAHTAQHHAPGAIEFENALDGIAEIGDIVSLALLAKLAKIAEVTANLGSGNIDQASKFFG